MGCRWGWQRDPLNWWKLKAHTGYLGALLAKTSLQSCPQYMTWEYCLKPSTYYTTTRKIMNYVVYGFRGQLKSNCLFKKTEDITSIRSTHQVSQLEGNSSPIGRVNPLHPPTASIRQEQRRPRTRAQGEGNQTYNLTKEEVRVLSVMGWEQEGMLYICRGTLKVLTVTIVPIFSMTESW